MNLLALAINSAERAPLTDTLAKVGIAALCARSNRALSKLPQDHEPRFAAAMNDFPIAMHTEAANRQHYDIPAPFFETVLGSRKKYSCCLYPGATVSLDEAEEYALAETCRNAGVTDGMRILELGSGWGSLSLYIASRFPNTRVTSISNSRSQREYILGRGVELGLTNLTVVTADVNMFQTNELFDRVVSVEMFEHMSNWQRLLAQIRGWLSPIGKLFIHVFTHRARSYRFDQSDPADWIARHFFTGGVMPARDLPHRFPNLFDVENEVHWSGLHYQNTALDWLANFDRDIEKIRPILSTVYGPRHASLWQRRWRLFFLSTAGLFGFDNGSVWGVGQYLMAPVR
ncbi:SAM-dependent methyltransferase [Rhizobium grahamii]|uniref:SAM-dependent methyltransferase n=1 Tax=Rhizobium grahamii TaxID=1120045 RepID=A0A370KEP4_9HYPH|nr:cyclopropane-fatty-acyl-phospholipid synthase family protein [Rhizobium grahamii]RDJ02691.1 SAM-dependent methyltransferase [Rhizobium grahamii]